MSKRNFNPKQLRQAMINFSDSAYEISEIWEDILIDSDVDEVLIDFYPFQKDFNQVVEAIEVWRKNVEKVLR